MDADDPRHGSMPGHSQHQRIGEMPCDPCRAANALYQRRRRKIRALYGDRIIDATGSVRRVQALMCLGWSYEQVAIRSGVNRKNLWLLARRPVGVHRSTAARIAAVYEELCMTTPPTDTKGQRISASRARNMAAREGFASPLMWDDIDSDPAPIGKRRAGTDYDSADIVDEATVLRILQGEVLPANAAERREVMRRWLKAGHSERSLCERMGWRDGRYTPGEAA